MSSSSPFLLSPQPRARWMRFDTAQILKRFFFCERSLLVSQAAWIPAIVPLHVKTGLARFLWQSSETAHAFPAVCWKKKARTKRLSNSSAR
jgi:hypothetical protein